MFFYYYYLLLTGCWSFAQLPPSRAQLHSPPPPHAVIRGWGSACSSTQCLSAHSSPWELQISAWGGTEQLHTSCSAVGAGEALGVGRAECCWGAMLE